MEVFIHTELFTYPVLKGKMDDFSFREKNNINRKIYYNLKAWIIIQGNGVINETVLGSKLNKHDLNLEKKSWLMRPKVVNFDELPTSRGEERGAKG